MLKPPPKNLPLPEKMVFQDNRDYFYFARKNGLFKNPGFYPKDYQMSRIYHAERICYGTFPTRAARITPQQLREYIYKVLGNKWLQKKFPHAAELHSGRRPLIIRLGNGTNYSYAQITPNADILNFPVNKRHPHIILHEIAHLLSPHDDVQPHGREYCQTLLEITRYIFGEKQMKLLKKAMKQANCKYSKQHGPYMGKKGTYTYDEKKAFLERFKGKNRGNEPQPASCQVCQIQNEPTQTNDSK